MSEHHLSKPHGAGKSSYDLVDYEKVFRQLQLRKGMTVLDMACGPGDYVIAIAEIIGTGGVIYAADLWMEGLVRLQRKAEAKKIENIKTVVGDVSRRLPIDAETVDVCLVATVLHDFVREGVALEAIEEAARVLRTDGTLAVLEFKKIDGPPGPSIDIRLTPAEVERLVIPRGFIRRKMSDVGTYNYLITFGRSGYAKQEPITNLSF
jgi:ubiquinone/menaquinone biosynthesis C-methylase UbiE